MEPGFVSQLLFAELTTLYAAKTVLVILVARQKGYCYRAEAESSDAVGITLQIRGTAVFTVILQSLKICSPAALKTRCHMHTSSHD
jgi:hypothetical protein